MSMIVVKVVEQQVAVGLKDIVGRQDLIFVHILVNYIDNVVKGKLRIPTHLTLNVDLNLILMLQDVGESVWFTLFTILLVDPLT